MLRIILALLLLAPPAFALEVSIVNIDADEQTTLVKACREYDRSARVDGQTTVEECIVSLVDIAVRQFLRTRVRRTQARTLRQQERELDQEWTDRFVPQADLARCGDAEPDGTEECDPGMGNFDDTTPDSGCRSGCRNPYCGDGVVDSGEVCDPGEPGGNPRCRLNCAGLRP